MSASTLADDLDALPKAATVILLSGKNSQTGKKGVFGYYLPYFEYREQDPPLLFQLSAFRGNAPRTGRELVFGKRGNEAILVLQQDSKKAIVPHNVSGQHEPMYAATAWRGDWQVEVEVENIELWIEPPLEEATKRKRKNNERDVLYPVFKPRSFDNPTQRDIIYQTQRRLLICSVQNLSARGKQPPTRNTPRTYKQ